MTISVDYTRQAQSKRFSEARLGDMTGKTRKVSKGYPSGFVPDYRHAVETVAESEGLGSSGRVGFELVSSEDSFALKRKCLGTNVVGYDQFGVPLRVFSLSKMSYLERRDLEGNLKSELEQVRVLRSKLASSNSDAMVRPPIMDIHSHQNVSKTNRPAMVASFPKSTNMSTSLGKKKGGLDRNGPRTKGGLAAPRRTESVKQCPPRNISLPPLMKQCEVLLTRLMEQHNAYIFSEPVDIEKLMIPDYFDIIKYPMDLGTVKKKLLSGQYLSPMEFAADVRLTFQNALTYNPVGHDVHVLAGIFSKFFEVRWKPIQKRIPATVYESASKSSIDVEPEIAYMPPIKKPKTFTPENNVKQEKDKQAMSALEKQKLSEELESCLEELPESIIDFLKGSSMKGNQVSEDEIEIDIDTLGDDTLLTLRKLLDDYKLEKQKNQTIPEQSEVVIPNALGFSNFSVQPHKENGPADEDVDIGVDDPPPVSSSTPIEIDKDDARRNSSSSSSSTSSGSTSGDSGNSSASEHDGAKNLVPANPINETVEHRVEQKESDLGDRNSKDLLDGHADQLKTSSVEPNSHLEGESAPLDRQASPEKLYRAALLRSRFADIISKAQENTAEKGERPDPERLKLDREELERRRKEEKVRFQAEAKAAEEAKKRAAREAAAEAKRRRDLEREAARQALQKMEKTVEINENSDFMDDLEMLRTAGPDDEFLQGLTEEASPENSQNSLLGSFKFPAGSSNPLEQLGLYMKNDEEDEEEDKGQSTLDASNDPEEGEID